MTLTSDLTNPAHPGVWLRKELAGHPMTMRQLAQQLRVTEPTIRVLLSGRGGLSATMALRFEKAFGICADTALQMQAAYDLAQARSRADEITVGRVRRPGSAGWAGNVSHAG